MIKYYEENGEKMVAVVLGGKAEVDINDYRNTLISMFEMASLWDSFAKCLNEGDVYRVLKIIQAFGFPECEGKEVSHD